MSKNNDPFSSGDSLQKLVDNAKKKVDRKSEQPEAMRLQGKSKKEKKGIEKRCLVCVGESHFLALQELVVLKGILGSPTTLKSCLDKMISEYLNTHEKLKKEASREISRL